MIVGYARVSTQDQDLTIQREALVAAGCERIFEEKQSGATATDRPVLGEALRFVREGDLLMVTRLDRLARSLPDLRTILDDLTSRKVGFRCLQQAVDTTDSTGRLMLNILGAFAEFELDIRRERQREGIEKAKASGIYKGRGPVVNREAVYRLTDQELLGPSEVARRLGISRATVYRVLEERLGNDLVDKSAAG